MIKTFEMDQIEWDYQRDTYMTNTNTAVDCERRGQVLIKLGEVLSRLLVTELGHTQNISWKAKEN